MVSISIVLLTFNRKEIVDKVVRDNIKKAGYEIKEIIWVDNGSSDGVDLSDIADVSIRHKKNTGVGKGYNTGFRLATGDVVVVPGTDMYLPEGWLKNFTNFGENLKIKATNGSFAYKKECFTKYGYLREDFGLYGRDEEEYGSRINCRIKMVEIEGAKHYGVQGSEEYNKNEEYEYWKMKNEETNNKEKLAKLKELTIKKEYYNPYG